MCLSEFMSIFELFIMVYVFMTIVHVSDVLSTKRNSVYKVNSSGSINHCPSHFVTDHRICLTSVTRAKPKEKNEICHSVSTHAVKCDGLFFVL